MDPELRRRLARFDRPVAPPPRPAATGDPLRDLLASGARWCQGPPTGYLRLEKRLEGREGPAIARALDPTLPGGPVAVLDTETTGLESGTGTLVFVVGVVHWSAAGRQLVQFFLPEPAGEKAFLEAAVAEISRAATLLSYNGRSFDLPRLRARLRLHRLDDDVLDRPHLDLLHPVRRLVRNWLADARLKTVEEALLEEVRDGDLPGEFAPEVYRTLQFDRRDAGLRDVMHHNARDVENLPRLVERVAGILRGERPERIDPGCALEAARIRVARGEGHEVGELLGRAIEAGTPKVRASARGLRAWLLRRAGDHAGAAREWEARLRDRPADLAARVELAKLLEHRLGDRPRALALVEEARRLLELRDGGDPALSAALDHRYRRLVRRVGRVP